MPLPRRCLPALALPFLLTLGAAGLAGCPLEDVNAGTGGGIGGGGGGGGDSAPARIVQLEDEAFVLVNRERIDRGIDALVMDVALRALARDHSEDMLARDFFAHNNPEGESPFDRMRAAGIPFASAAENIAWNNFGSAAEVAVDGWMNSQGHRNNILNPALTLTGMGVAGDAVNGHYFTQVFVRPPAKGTGPAEVHIETDFLPLPSIIEE